jgi:hypothetical protein
MTKSPFRRKRVWIVALGIAAGSVAAFAPVGQSDNYGGGGGGYVQVCRTIDYTHVYASHYESCAGTAKLGRFNVYKLGLTCSAGLFQATYKWTVGNPYPVKWSGNFCVDGLDHWTDVFALNPSQMYLDWIGNYPSGDTAVPDNAQVDWGLYK